MEFQVRFSRRKNRAVTDKSTFITNQITVKKDVKQMFLPYVEFI
jgi:hypothetical protein